uniref:Ovule protein n=1 Tax=Schistosoma curassoni TaxID=6186 RepID=A0A183JDM0_9TREM
LLPSNRPGCIESSESIVELSHIVELFLLLISISGVKSSVESGGTEQPLSSPKSGENIHA